MAMKKDILASGGRKATFVVGNGKDAPVELLNHVVMSEEDRLASEAADAGMVIDESKVEKPVMVFTPRGASMLVRRKPLEELSPLLQGVDSVTQEVPAEGIVLAIGKKVVDVSLGDHVVFGKYSGTEFKLNGETLLIMNEEDIKGTVDVAPLPGNIEEVGTLGGCTNFAGIPIARA